MVDKEALKNNKDVFKQAEINTTKMQNDVMKFCVEMGWGCWIGDKEVTRKNNESR